MIGSSSSPRTFFTQRLKEGRRAEHGHGLSHGKQQQQQVGRKINKPSHQGEIADSLEIIEFVIFKLS